MSETMLVTVPNIGDFHDVEVIEVLVAQGDHVEAEQPLITIESEKAALDVPAPADGVVAELLVTVGDRVSEGSPICRLEQAGEAQDKTAQDGNDKPGQAKPTSTPAPQQQPRAATAPRQDKKPAPQQAGTQDQRHGLATTQVVVIGAGPGGYTAAFRCADLGLQVTLVEREAVLGGVCLNIGCIPSKALLHAAAVIRQAGEMADFGLHFGTPQIELDGLRAFKNQAVERLTGGLAGLAKRRGVTVIHGEARFADAQHLSIETQQGTVQLQFQDAILATGSRPVRLPFLPEDPRIWDSTRALEVSSVPRRLLILGGGVIGLEMATVYHALGAEITVCELLPQLLAGADRDLVAPLEKQLRASYAAIWLETKVEAVEARKDDLLVRFSGKDAPQEAAFEAILASVGRRPNSDGLNLEAAGLAVDERGFVPVDQQQRTAVPHLFAIGDLVGQPMLAHKATHQAKVAAEVIAGQRSAFEPRCIPQVAYTDPEVAWVGLTEEAAGKAGVAVNKGVFPWAANGRSLGMGRSDGLTKLLFDADSGRLVGAGVTGPNASELTGELALAMEMGAEAEDIGLTIHAHPTLSETVAMAAEAVAGTLTDLDPPRRGKPKH